MKNTTTLIQLIIFLFCIPYLSIAIPLNTEYTPCNTNKENNNFFEETSRMNGEEIVFALGAQLMVQSANGSGRRLILDMRQQGNFENIIAAIWSIDGSKIIFTVRNIGERRAQLFIVDANGANLRLLFSSEQETSERRLMLLKDLSWSTQNHIVVTQEYYFFSIVVYSGTQRSTYEVDINNPQNFSTLGHHWSASSFDLSSRQYARFAYEGSERIKTGKVIVKNYNTGTEQVWFDSGVNALNKNKAIYLTWASPNSLYLVYEIVNQGTAVFRINNNNGRFSYEEVLKVNKVYSLSLSPNRNEAYISGTDSNNKDALFKVQLGNSGKVTNEVNVGFGWAPSWRQTSTNSTPSNTSTTPPNTSTSLAAPQLLSPANNASFNQTSVDFSWSTVSGADSYILGAIDAQNNAYAFPVSGTSYQLTGFPQGLWGWAVYGVKGTTEGAYSEVRIFTINGGALAGTSSSRARTSKSRTRTTPSNSSILKEAINKSKNTKQIVVTDASGRVIKKAPATRRSLNMRDILIEK